MALKKTSAIQKKSDNDFIQPFLIDHTSIRGRLVRVSKVLDDILHAHNYPVAVSVNLAEQIVIASLLAATLEEGGIITVQAKGDGPVRFIIVDIMAGGIIRGYADVNEEDLKKIIGKSRKKQSIAKILGQGYFAVTLDPGGEGQRYQGVVELKGDTISDTFKGYFNQSQQGDIELHVAVRAPTKTNKNWLAAGIIIERMPVLGGTGIPITLADQDDVWDRSRIFINTLQDEELLDEDITPNALLYRLFNEDGVRVFTLQPLKAGCRCSRERVEMVLKSVSKEELLESLDENDQISVHCQFCNKREKFTRANINKLFKKA